MRKAFGSRIYRKQGRVLASLVLSRPGELIPAVLTEGVEQDDSGYILGVQGNVLVSFAIHRQ